MASLHLAEQTGIEGFAKVVALKRVHPHLAASSELRRMFSTEAKLAARLDHPNIVTVYELGEVNDTYFICMEYLPGEDLAAILARISIGERMPVTLALWIAQAAATALQYAHELVDASGRPVGMVHRDVTPSNIMLTYHGVVKLLDFGIAKSITSDVLTREGVFKGKLSYAAPEQLNGELVDRRADVFCLGIVLWECLTGRRLFNAGTDAERIDAVRMRHIAPPSDWRPEIPPALDKIVLRALSRDRNERYDTAQEFRLALAEMSEKVGRAAAGDAVGWLEQVFGAERAVVKRAIAQGHNVESMVEALARMPKPVSLPSIEPLSSPGLSDKPARRAPRTAWSTDVAGGSSISSTPHFRGSDSIEIPLSFTPSPTGPVPFAGAPMLGATASDTHILHGQRSITPLVLAVAGLTALAVGGTILMFGRSSAPTPAVAAATGSIQVDTDPQGALVFVDGEMTGLRTPATVRQLPVGRAIKIRVERTGMAPADRVVTLTGTEQERVQFALGAASGRVRFTRVPSAARVYVNGRSVDATAPLDLEVGTHSVRVESADDVLWSAQIEVRSGEQQIEVGSK